MLTFFKSFTTLQRIAMLLTCFSLLMWLLSFYSDGDIADHNMWILNFLFITQDRWPLLGLAIVLSVWSLRRYIDVDPYIETLNRQMAPATIVVCLAICMLFIALIGRYLLLFNFDFARDEFLAVFDGRIFASGHVMMPIAPQWQSFYNALQPRLMLLIIPAQAFISFYLPMHALMRAAWSLVFDPTFLNPVLSCLSIIGIYAVGRQIWPKDKSAALISAILLASSPQFIFLATSTFSMSAHLAANILWLYLFLRREWRMDILTILIGFCAAGLHQLAFHIIFVIPFIVGLLVAQQKKRATYFIISYLLIILFWSDYHDLVTRFVGVQREVAIGNGTLTFLVVVLVYLSQLDVQNIYAMLVNLARFMVWQNPALLVFFCCGLVHIWHSKNSHLKALSASIFLALIIFLCAVPFQAWGWGYRYVHMYMLNFCLLAAYGWQWLSQKGQIKNAHAILASGLVYVGFVLLPFLGWRAHDLVARVAQPAQAIAQSTADIVLIDSSNLRFAYLVSRNAPDLSNRPLTMDLEKLSLAQLDDLCGRYKMALYDVAAGLSFGDLRHPQPDVDVTAQFDFLVQTKCATPFLTVIEK